MVQDDLVKAPQDSGGATIETSLRRWWTAWEKKDLSVLEEMALEDYVEFAGQGEGPRVGRSVLMDAARRAFQRFTITSWEIIDPVVRREGDVAIVAYRWTEQVTLDGRPTSLKGVATDVLVRRQGTWCYLSHHSTTLESAARR
ncbi:MAG: YybH family protein [Gemmatimonadota bacterium]